MKFYWYYLLAFWFVGIALPILSSGIILPWKIWIIIIVVLTIIIGTTALIVDRKNK